MANQCRYENLNNFVSYRMSLPVVGLADFAQVEETINYRHESGK